MKTILIKAGSAPTRCQRILRWLNRRTDMDQRTNIATEVVKQTGRQIVAAADFELATQYRDLAVKQLRTAASNLSIAAYYASHEYDNDERKLWRFIQSVATMVAEGALYVSPVEDRLTELTDALSP